MVSKRRNESVDELAFNMETHMSLSDLPKYRNVSRVDMVSVIASVLGGVIQQYDDLTKEASEVDPHCRAAAFYSTVKEQPFSLEDYIMNAAELVPCSDSAFVVALMYMAKVHTDSLPNTEDTTEETIDLKKSDGLFINSYTVHRLFIASLLLACKFLDDNVCTNKDFAYVGGISEVAEMNLLEIKMLDYMDYHLEVTPESYNTFLENVINQYIESNESRLFSPRSVIAA